MIMDASLLTGQIYESMSDVGKKFFKGLMVLFYYFL
jgi:hypothetical protein